MLMTNMMIQTPGSSHLMLRDTSPKVKVTNWTAAYLYKGQRDNFASVFLRLYSSSIAFVGKLLFHCTKYVAHPTYFHAMP
jgi:hypothetical protein